MSDIKKLTAEEIDQIKQIKANYSELAMALGELELQISSFNHEKSHLLESHKQLLEKEGELAQKLQDKYGQGSINLKTGEITQ
jgi:chromosome segregation ATPase